MFGLNINNFRGFEDTTINISKINILIGENSGGKSSFIKLLLLLKQSMGGQIKDKKIKLKGNWIDLGTFDNFINHNSSDKSFTISLSTDEEYIKYFIDSMLGKEEKIDDFTDKCAFFLGEPTILTFSFTKDDNEIFTNYIEIYNKKIGKLKIIITEKNGDFFSSIEDIQGQLNFIDIENKEHIISDEKLTVVGFMLLASPDPIIAYDEKYNTNLFNQLAFLLLSQNYFISILHKIKYINPVKFQPTRILLTRDSTQNRNINDYETLIDVLSSLSNTKDDASIEILQKFNKAIQELGIANEIKLESTSSVSELKVRISGIWNSIIDVGYGVGLQIPIILQAIISQVENKGDILIIEQPEIHLHPALHSKFMDILVKYSGNTKLIIETHSEHIIRKLQLLVKQRIVHNQDVNVYYFKNEKGIFNITNHQLLENGQLHPIFPKGFYDNTYSLSKELY